MDRIIVSKCRACDDEVAFTPSSAEIITCPHCNKTAPVRNDAFLIENSIVRNCVCCGHDTLYIQKDFNRNLGLTIVLIGVLASVIAFSREEPFYAMLSLVVTAVVDLIIYSAVRDVTVCYSCHAVYRGFSRNPAHQPFELKNLEKYGGRDPRF
jgi:hypothetical protein